MVDILDTNKISKCSLQQSTFKKHEHRTFMSIYKLS